MRKRLLCSGGGYCARALAPSLLAEGWDVAATSRREAGRAAIESVGMRALDADDDVAVGEALEEATHLLVSAAPDAESGDDPTLRLHGERIARRAPRLEWIGYLSSLSVYGDFGGAWIDESAPAEPSTRRGKARRRAEIAWESAHPRAATAIFRLAGIYGAGRNRLIALRRGTAKRIVRRGHAFNRIHVDDVAAFVRASMARPRGGAIYNACDSEPAPADEVVVFAAELLGIPPPPPIELDEAKATMSSMAREFYVDSKRVDSSASRRELGVTLLYPTYREGLRALARELSASEASDESSASRRPSAEDDDNR